MSESQDWPYTGTKMAWGTQEGMELTAIPLYQSDLKDGLKGSEYRERLADRVAWMIRQEEDPEQGIQLLREALEEKGAWMGQTRFASPEEATEAMIMENPMFSDLFAGGPYLSSEDYPLKVRAMPAAVEAMEEVGLEGWLALAFEPVNLGMASE
jgi:hypothetical protein